MKKMKRLVALLLALTMVLGMLPAAVAEEAAQAPAAPAEDLPEIVVADDQELLACLEDETAQRLIVRDELTLTLARDLDSNDEVYWAENGVLYVNGGTLTCAAIDMMAFTQEELAQALGEEPFWNMDAPYRNIWVFEGVSLEGVVLPENRTLSWVAPLTEENVITGEWPALQTLFVPMDAGLTVNTDLNVTGAVIVNGAMFLENGAVLTANELCGDGSCWWTAAETVNCDTIYGVIYPHGEEEEMDGIRMVTVYDVPSLLYYLTDGVKQNLAIGADMTLPLDEDLVTEDGLYTELRLEDDEFGRRGDCYHLEIVGSGTLTVSDFGLPIWDQSQLDAALEGNYPIQSSEGVATLWVENELYIRESVTLPANLALALGAYANLILEEGVRVTTEGGIWNMNLGEDLADLNRGLSEKNNALLNALYYNEETGASVRVLYMSEEDFLSDWAEKVEAYPLLELVLISTDENGEAGSFDLTGDWTIGALGEVATQDGTTVTIKSGAKVETNHLWLENPQDTEACLLVLEEDAHLAVGHLNVQASAFWPADADISFDSAEIRYYAPMLFFHRLGWDEERQVHVDDFDMGGGSEWPMEVSPVMEKVGFVIFCYPADPAAGAPADSSGWIYGPLDVERMNYTDNLEFELLEENLRDENTVPWESYRIRTSAWSSEEGIGISCTEGGYTMNLHVYSHLSTVEYFSAPSREEQYAVKNLYCDTYSSTQEEYYLIFEPEYDGQYVDHVDVLNDAPATVEPTDDENIWKITIHGTESFSLDLCLYVGDEYSEPWEWYHGIWVECGSMTEELTDVSSAEELLAYLTDGQTQYLAANAEIELELTEDVFTADGLASRNDENGSHYQVRFTGDGVLHLTDYEAVVNNEADWQDAVDGLAGVDAEALHIIVNDAITVRETVEWGDVTLHLGANSYLNLEPGTMVSSNYPYWNLNYGMENPGLTKDLSLKSNAFADVLYYNEADDTSLRVFYADEETFLRDLPAKREQYSHIELLILSTDDGNGNYGAAEIDSDWDILNGWVYSLMVQDGTTLTFSTDLEVGELVAEDADDESVREGITAVTIADGVTLVVRDYVYIEGDLAYGTGNADFRSGADITGSQPGLMAMFLQWDEEAQGHVEDENNVTGYLGRILPANEHPVLFYVQSYENGQWTRVPVIPQAEGVDIWEIPEEAAAGQENGDYFVRLHAHDWYCEYEYTAELNGKTYTMGGDSYPNEVEFFSTDWDDYGSFLNEVVLSPVEHNEFYAVVTNGDLSWSNVRLRKDLVAYATLEDTLDDNVKRVVISPDQARQMVIDGVSSMDAVVIYDAAYPDDWEEPHEAGIWIHVDNGMVFAEGENAMVPDETLNFEDLPSFTTQVNLAPKDSVTGVLYYVWYNWDEGRWMADRYHGDCLWQEGESISMEPQLDENGEQTGRTVITGMGGGESAIHHTGFHEEDGQWVPNGPGMWHGVPLRVWVGKSMEAASEAEIEAALADETVTEINIVAPITITKDLYVYKPVCFLGNGHLSVQGNAVLTLEEPNFRDSAEVDTDYWLMFVEYPDDVRTHHLCGNMDAAAELAEEFGGYIPEMHTDMLPSNGEEARTISFNATWPELHIGDSVIHPGNVYVMDGANMTFDRLFSMSENFNEDQDHNEMETPVRVNRGSLTVNEDLNIQGNVYWAANASVNFGGNVNIGGTYPHLSFRWLENQGEGWFEPTEWSLDTNMGSMPKTDYRFVVFYATVPSIQNGSVLWETMPVHVTDDRPMGSNGTSAISLLKSLQDEQIGGGDTTNADYFVRINPEHYDWYSTISLRASVYGYQPSIEIPVELPEVGFYSQPEYNPEYYLDRFKLSENPEENVFYLIAHTPEHAGHWMHHYEFHNSADRIDVEDLGDGIIKITLQDWVDIYEGFDLHAEVYWEDGTGEVWPSGRSIWVEEAENTRPYLSVVHLDNWGDGFFLNSENMHHQSREMQSPYWHTHPVVFFENTYDPERESWISSPVEVEMDRDDVARLVSMYENEDYQIREDALLGGRYFYEVIPYENIWEETVNFVYTTDDGQVLNLPLHLRRDEWGFYNDARISNETYITDYTLNPVGENVFYLGVDVPVMEDGRPGYYVNDAWLCDVFCNGEPVNADDYVAEINRLSNQIWQIVLTDAAARSEGFNLEFELELDFGDGRMERRHTGIWCGSGDLFDRADANMEINCDTYLFFRGTNEVLKYYNTGEVDENGWDIWKMQWLDGMDIPGVSYDLDTNTLTLTDAQLEQMYLSYERGWRDEELNMHVEGYNLPNAELTMILNGENTIAASGINALVASNGVDLTIAGTGTLNVSSAFDGQFWGNPAVGLWGAKGLTVTDSATVIADTRDLGAERDEHGELIYDEEGNLHVFGTSAIQGDWNLRTVLTVEGDATLELSGTRGGLDCVSTVIFKDNAHVASQEIVINGEASLRPSMTVTDNAEVTVTAVPGDWYSHALQFIDGGRLYMKGGRLTVDNTALSTPECALGFESQMGGIKGGLQMTGGTLEIKAAGGTGIGLSNGNSYQQSGGTVHVTVGSDNQPRWGSWGMTTDPRTEFIMTGGEATFIATQSDDINSGGILYRSNDGTVAGGKLNCYGIHPGGQNLISGIYVPMGSLSITGGEHSFVVLDSNGDENLDAMRGVAVLVLEGGYLAFTGGSSRMAGYCAIWSVGSNNCITYGKNMHAVSNATGNELSMVYYEDTYTDETGTWTDQIYWFEEDNLVTYPEGDEEYDESQLSHDVTISSEKGSAVINSAAVELSVTNGAPAQGAKMSVRAIISILEGGHADVAVTMPVGMEPLADSIYLDNQKLESLEDIQITGPAVLRFDVVPVNRFEQTIGVKVFNDSQTEIGQSTLRFLPGEFDASAPSHVETPTVTITGKAHPGYTVKVSDVNNNVVSAQVNELGYYSVTFNALVPGENSLRIFLNDVYMKDVNVLYEEVQVRIESLTIRNNVHNSYGETVEEFVKILYPNGTPTRKFYTYWPGQDLFTLEVNIPGAPDNMVLKVIITDYDGREYEVVLTEIRDGFYKGYYLNEDPNSPPVGFEVHWLRITQINEGEEEEGHTVKTEIIPIMDPSGFVYEDVESNRVEGARVTLERGEMSDGQIQYTGDWDAESYGQINGYLTNVNGEFQWDVPKGFWRVRVEKDGYAVTYSDWMEVPPPQLGVAIDIGPSRLAENKAALYETVQIVEDGHQAVVSFTQPVLFSKVENALVITDENGEYLEGQIRIGQVLGQSSQGNLVKQVIFDTDMPMEHVEVRFAEHAGSAFQKDSAASGSFRPLEITGLVKQGGKVGVVLHYGSRSVMRETLIVASYDAQGRFLSMTSAVAVNGNNEVACDPNAVTVKAFVVESMETMIPLCEAASNG